MRVNSVIILSSMLLDKTIGGQVEEEEEERERKREREKERLQAEDGRRRGGVTDNCNFLAGDGESLRDMVKEATAQIQKVPHGMETVRALGM